MTNKRTILVDGEGEILATPDRAIVALAVEKRDEDQSKAQAETKKIIDDVLNLCASLSIKEQHIRTAQLHIQPEYDWNNETRERRLIGYLVRRGVEIRLQDLSDLGTLLEQSTALGINQASPPRLESSRRQELQREALQSAAQNARLNAAAVASTLGASLGAVRKICTTRIQTGPGPYPPRGAMMRSAAPMAADGGDDAVQTGEIRIEAQITVKFDLEIA